MDDKKDEKRKQKTVYTVLDRGSGRPYWMRVGIGWENRDGSIQVRLDAVPSTFTLHIRDWQPPREANGQTPQPERA
jgi:hypothetical protein